VFDGLFSVFVTVPQVEYFGLQLSVRLSLDTAELSFGNQFDLQRCKSALLVQQHDQHIQGQLTLPLGASVEAIVPTFHVVVGSDGLKVNAPGCGGPGGACNPGPFNVLGQLL